MLIKFAIFSKIVLVSFLFINITTNSSFASDNLINPKITLENSNNRAVLIINNNNHRKQNINLLINGQKTLVTFTNSKANIPKEFAGKSILSIRHYNDSILKTDVYFIIGVFSQNFIISFNIIKALILIVVIITALIIIKFIFSILSKIILPVIILALIAIFLMNPTFTNKDIFHTIKEYKDKILTKVENLF
ncbi:MAG: hypothetical protein ACQPRH_05290 [Solitalea-like symbiont of Tyrophagus putrescentiae]